MFPGFSCPALTEPGEIFAVPEISLNIRSASQHQRKGMRADLHIHIVGIVVPQANSGVSATIHCTYWRHGTYVNPTIVRSRAYSKASIARSCHMKLPVRNAPPRLTVEQVSMRGARIWSHSLHVHRDATFANNNRNGLTQ
jgi:hypothetical protein